MAVGANKVQVVIFLLYASMFLFGMNGAAVEDKVCPLYCFDVEYMTCNGKVSYPGCINCCQAPSGCTLHFTDGGSEYCA